MNDVDYTTMEEKPELEWMQEYKLQGQSYLTKALIHNL